MATYETFKYIYKRDGQANDTAIESKYSKSEMCALFIAWSHASGYAVFPHYTDYLDWIETVPEPNRQYHEVIMGERPQRIKFDLDIECDKIQKLRAESLYDLLSDEQIAEHALSAMTVAIRDAMLISYGIDEVDIVVCESSDHLTKWSFHLILNKYYVLNNANAQWITEATMRALPREFAPFVDVGVNKRLQNFRLTGNHKNGRTKRIATLHDVTETIICNVDDMAPLPDVAVAKPAQTTTDAMNGDDLAEIMKLCDAAGILKDHSQRSYSDNTVLFWRLNATYCEFCGDTHVQDNTVVVRAYTTDSGIANVYLMCMKDKRRGSRHLGSFVPVVRPTNIATPSASTKWIDTVIERACCVDRIHADSPLRPSLFNESPNIIRYEAPTIAAFELAPTLCVKAAMKMGKTNALRAYIEQHFANAIVRFVSFRQTFSNNIKDKFADFVMYSDLRGQIDHPRLIVQVESLHRVICGPDIPDLLVLDECESIFEQFDSGLLRYFSAAFAVFQWLLRYSKHVVCMDANIGDRTYRTLQRMRAQPITYHVNEYKNALDDTYYLTGDRSKWLAMLYASLQNDERVVIPISSLAEAKAIHRNLSTRFPTKRVQMYSSETSQTERQTDFVGVDEKWVAFDVLIYTPTISAGISFEARHFDKIFGYFTDMSCPVETCIQMIGRIRNVGTHNHYVYLTATGNTQPTSVPDIMDALHRNRESLMRDFAGDRLEFTYGPTGNIQYHKSDYFYLWVENMRIRNLSRNSFIYRLVDYIRGTGATPMPVDDECLRESEVDADEAATLERDHKSTRLEIKSEMHAAIAEAPDLTYDEISDIQTAIVQQQDVSAESRTAYARYRLRRDYQFYGELTRGFVAKYNDNKIRAIYRNLVRISACETVDEALRQIQREEREHYEAIMQEGADVAHRDLTYKYTFTRHKYALEILRALGWRHMFDPAMVHEFDIMTALDCLGRTLKMACVEFAIKWLGPDRMLDMINKILHMMYGVRIFAPKDEPTIYRLRQNKLFAYGGPCETQPNLSIKFQN